MKRQKKLLATICLCGLLSMPVFAGDFATTTVTTFFGSLVEKVTVWVSSLGTEPCDNDNDGCAGSTSRPGDRPPARPTPTNQ